jgi:hypothetical protein
MLLELNLQDANVPMRTDRKSYKILAARRAMVRVRAPRWNVGARARPVPLEPPAKHRVSIRFFDVDQLVDGIEVPFTRLRYMIWPEVDANVEIS